MLFNNSLVPGNFLAGNGRSPDGATYDSAKGEMFVGDWGSNNVSVISDTTNKVVATVAVGHWPERMAYDAALGEVFVTNMGSNNVSVVNDTSNKVVATVAVGPEPYEVAYDAALGEAFVTNSESANVSVISDVSNKVVATVAVGSVPVGVAYDVTQGEVFVTNEDAWTVSVISDATNKVVATVTIAALPFGVAYDAARGEVFVTNYLSNNVNVISDATNKAVATVTVGTDPEGVAYDSGTGEVFVANYLTSNVSVICDGNTSCGGTTDLNKVVATITVGSGPEAAAYDSGTGEVFVANAHSGNVSVISDVTNKVVATVTVGNSPDGIAYDSGKGEVFVANAESDTVSVILDTTNTVVANVPVGWGPMGVAYDSEKREVFVANYDSGNVSVIADTTDQDVVTVPVGGSPRNVAYDPVLGELLVANAGLSEVSVISDLTNKVLTTVAVGDQPYGVAFDNGAGHVFVTDYAQGSVSVLSWPVYSVTFAMIGLPAGIEWWVNLTGETPQTTTGWTVSMSLPNGSYTYAVGTQNKSWVAAGGSFTVNGAGLIEPVTFGLQKYTVTFTESGLPSGTEWWVNITGQSPLSSTITTISLSLPNGSFTYTVATVNKDYSTSGNSFMVSGGAPPILVTFSLVTFEVTLTESGLPSGIEWWVNITGQSPLSSTGTTITTSLPNGEYAYSSSAPGYPTRTGSVTVSGASPSPIAVDFTSSSSTSSGLPTIDYAIIGGEVAIAAIAVAALLLHRRGKAPPRPVTMQSQPGTGAPPTPP